MAKVVTKGLIGVEDLSVGTSTFSRATSVGGSQAMTQIDLVTGTNTKTLTNKTLTAPVITNPSTTGTDSGVETLANKTLTSPVINGTPTGTGIPTTYYLGGTGLGNYTTANTGTSNLLNVDGTNLSKTLTVPVGWKLMIRAAFTAFNTVGGADETVVCIVKDGTTAVAAMQTQASNASANSLIEFVFTGDGASHTWALQFCSITGGTSTIVNGTIGSTAVATVPFINF